MLLADVVATVDAVSATRSRLVKADALAVLLRSLDAAEVPIVVGLLTARPRQGRIGVGWRRLTTLSVEHADAPGLTVLAVDEGFERLATTSGSGSAALRDRILDDLASRATRPEWDFLARVVIGEVRTGALEGVLVDAIAKASDRDPAAVRRAAMLTGDLGETAVLALHGDAAELDAVGLRVGRGVQPMLASTAASIEAALEGRGESAVEYKLDGARIQVHRDGDEVRVFTRSLADITARVPEIVDVARSLPVDRVILDGETLALDEDGGPRPFQDTMARFGSAADGDAGAPQLARLLQPWFFDILHRDGRDLIDEPLHVRQRELDAVVGEHRMRGIRTADPIEAQEFARQALADRHEGVMVKSLDEPYAAGRRGRGWVKVKPVLTFDLVVLGVEWGSGRRQGLLSNLHLGARDPDGAFGPAGGFVMVGKTFKGLTDETLAWQTAHFLEREQRRTASTVFVAPATVVEIAIDGVQRSTRYPGGVALRFARVKGYRPDRDASTADTIGALRDLLR